LATIVAACRGIVPAQLRLALEVLNSQKLFRGKLMNSETIDSAKKRFIVSIHEIRQELVFADEFAGQYVKTVMLSDGTTRTVELTPMVRDGIPVMELKDTRGCTCMGIIRVATSAHTNGKLMVRIIDRDVSDAARAERRSPLPTSPVLPPDTSLISIPEFVPPGFTQGIEILNDNATPMSFVVAVLSAHLGLSPEASNHTMLAIHTRGGALLPTPSLAEAQRIATGITAEAAKHGYALVCRPVGVGP
jgi:ATP-dependent Clp protease adapter protein ClpS